MLSLIHAENLEAIWTDGVIDISRRSKRKKTKLRFAVEKIEPAIDPGQPRRPWLFEHGIIHIMGGNAIPDGLERPAENEQEDDRIQINHDGIGGLDRQLELLNQRIADMRQLFDENERDAMPDWFLEPSRILLHGASGTGKTLVLNKLKPAGFRKVISIDSQSVRNAAAVQKAFSEAASQQPSLIVMDNLHLVAGSGDRYGSNELLASTIASQMEELGSAHVFVVAATGNPNAIDLNLRPCFDCEIELPVPDANARKGILKALRVSSALFSDNVVDDVGDRTHGYVGRDLRQLCKAARDSSLQRSVHDQTQAIKTNGENSTNNAYNESTSDNIRQKEQILLVDFEQALRRVRPTAMREISLSTPNVSMSDIGGYDNVKDALFKCIELPFKCPDLFTSLRVQPPHGILLYGPPGCSKTLTAKAVAASSGLNFLAVKGAELTSMYVGETERKVREVFSKARAASPAVLFFDEIDAIASTRGTTGGGPTGSGTPGLNVLATLLNEMDGIESLKGVLVLAATNRPDVLDLALLRPGRFDAVLYVPPPALEARRKILEINTRDRVSQDVDVGALAERTAGHSGAEIVSLCNDAAYIALRRAYEKRQRGESDVQEELVQRADFDVALGEARKMITQDMVAGYEKWAAEHTNVSKLK